MKLTIIDRLALLPLLPADGKIILLRPMRTVRGALPLSEEEIVSLRAQGLIDAEGRLLKGAGAYEAEIPFGEITHEWIKDALRKREADGKLKDQEIGLYEKFVEQS